MSIELKTIFFENESNESKPDLLSPSFQRLFDKDTNLLFWKIETTSMFDRRDFAISVSTSENKNNWTKAKAPNKSTNSFLLFVIVY